MVVSDEQTKIEVQSEVPMGGSISVWVLRDERIRARSMIVGDLW